MKKIIALVMAAAMILSIGVMSVSAATSYSQGDIVVADGSYIDYKITDYVAPGSKIYVVIGVYDKNDPVEKVKVQPADSDSKDWVAKDSKANVVRLKDGTTRYECVEVKVKNASLNTYDEDEAPYKAYVEFFLEYKESADDDFDIMFDIAYEEEYANGTISDQLALFVLEKNDELYITDEDGYVTIEGEAVGDTKVLAGLNTDIIDKIEDKYGEEANLEYFNFSGTFKRVKKGVLTIDPHDDDYRYLYEYKNGELENLSKYYDKSDECFVIEFGGSSFELGTYVISNEKLSVSSSGSVSSSTNTGSSSNSNIHNNPMTGAIA